jgi:hypothetical protein
MRPLFATVVLSLLMGVATARAEQRIFIIVNNGDGYGIDRCLANGEPCGKAAASAYCKRREFAQVLTYNRVAKDEITGAVPTSSPMCHGGQCDEFIAIVCAR